MRFHLSKYLQIQSNGLLGVEFQVTEQDFAGDSLEKGARDKLFIQIWPCPLVRICLLILQSKDLLGDFGWNHVILS